MRIWPRRKPDPPPPPVVLPSLDRLAGLIERVVELVDEVSGAPSGPQRHTPTETRALPSPPPEPEQVPAPAAHNGGWIAFVSSPNGYALLDRNGTLPSVGDDVELDGSRYRVLRWAPSPLPGDGRPCAVVEMEEPPRTERTSDA